MMFRSLLWIVTLLFVVPAGAAQPVPSRSMLEAHNAVRGQHGLPPLSWSRALAADAGEWADRLAEEMGCRMQHTEAKGQGENLYWASAVIWSDGRREVQAVTPAMVVNSWAAERADYDHATNRCRTGKVCGHYTQLVWKATTHVGCARRTCPDDSQLWVCRYLPPGNWIGEKPY